MIRLQLYKLNSGMTRIMKYIKQIAIRMEFTNFSPVPVATVMDMVNEENDLCCDELLEEIALGAVVGLFDESECEDLETDGLTTPEGESSFGDNCFSRSIS